VTRVTSKLQVTIPKAIAQRYGIEPGGVIDWLPAGEAIRVVPQGKSGRVPDRAYRVELFDRATERQRARDSLRQGGRVASDRGWQREELYGRGGAG
jgi:bifunctional DNA-binding transcriptional regulator/antitoxin component of YhaV-PrlF toxin-antitoxin module